MKEMVFAYVFLHKEQKHGFTARNLMVKTNGSLSDIFQLWELLRRANVLTNIGKYDLQTKIQKKSPMSDKFKKNNTIQTLITEWYDNYIIKHRKHPQQIKQQIDADIIPLLGNRELNELQTLDITKALDIIVKRGSPVHANKVLSTLKQLFNYAVNRGEIISNPAANLRARDIGGVENTQRSLSYIR